MDTEFQFCTMKKFWRRLGILTVLNCTLTMVKMVSCVYFTILIHHIYIYMYVSQRGGEFNFIVTW